MNLKRIFRRVLPAQTLDLPHNCQKSLFDDCDAACGTGHLGIEPLSLGSKAWILRGDCREKLMELRKLRPSSCCVTRAVATQA